METSQFANSEMATTDWVDNHLPSTPEAMATLTLLPHLQEVEQESELIPGRTLHWALIPEEVTEI